MTKRKPREIAARLLVERETSPHSIELLLARDLPGLSGLDRHLCQELVFGVTRQRALLDWLIARKLRQPNLKLKPTLAVLLRLGLYQLFWLDRVPDHAVLHETVDLAANLACQARSGFINAILRAYTRERADTVQLINQLKTDRPHLGYSHPKWLFTRWLDRWGPSPTRQLLEWNNTPPHTFARINTLRTDPGQLLSQWREEGVGYDFIRHDWIPENSMFQLKQHPALAQLPSFHQGAFYIQDPGTLLPSCLLDPQPGDAILDLCAAPGGKTTHLAQLTQNQARILACDIQPDRLRLIDENCARLGVTCVTTRHLEHHPTDASPASDPILALGRFNRVLVDAPCSNTGVMRRRVELRWRIRPQEIERLSRLQSQLLRRAAAVLTPGGVLVYSTCSLEPEENEDVVRGFLANHPGFKLQCERFLIPFRDGTDGAYVARLQSS